MWDDIPAYNADIPPDHEPKEGNPDPNSHESLVGRVELMNLKKIELGINLDEPVHISMKEYTPGPKKEIDPSDRPYQHQFEWYEDYYSKVGEEIGNKVQIIIMGGTLIGQFYQTSYFIKHLGRQLCSQGMAPSYVVLRYGSQQLVPSSSSGCC